MRVPYVDDPLVAHTSREEEIHNRIKARRQPGHLLTLDLAFLHSLGVVDPWSSFLGSISERRSLPADIKELAICRVALLNKAQFEWSPHAPLAKEADVDQEGVRDDKSALTSAQQAVLIYTDEMTRNVTVSKETFENLQIHFSHRQIVEITATVAAFNCSRRFLVALDVGERNGSVDDKDWVNGSMISVDTVL